MGITEQNDSERASMVKCYLYASPFGFSPFLFCAVVGGLLGYKLLDWAGNGNRLFNTETPVYIVLQGEH